jgi:hypothetical protein
MYQRFSKYPLRDVTSRKKWIFNKASVKQQISKIVFAFPPIHPHHRPPPPPQPQPHPPFYLRILCILPYTWLNIVIQLLFLYCFWYVSSQLNKQTWQHALTAPPSYCTSPSLRTTGSSVNTAHKSLLPTLCGPRDLMLKHSVQISWQLMASAGTQMFFKSMVIFFVKTFVVGS